jgi:hypothetical protein
MEQELAHVVKTRGLIEPDHVGLGNIHRGGDASRAPRDTTAVTVAAGLRLDRAEERLEDHARRVPHLPPDALELASRIGSGGPLRTVDTAQRFIGRANGIEESRSDAAVSIIVIVRHVTNRTSRKPQG